MSCLEMIVCISWNYFFNRNIHSCDYDIDLIDIKIRKIFLIINLQLFENYDGAYIYLDI